MKSASCFTFAVYFSGKKDYLVFKYTFFLKKNIIQAGILFFGKSVALSIVV